MAKNYIQPGNTVTVTAPANVAAGRGVAIKSLVGVTAFGASAGEDVEIHLVGVFEVPVAGTAPTPGDEIFLNVTTGLFTTDDAGGDNPYAATVIEVAPSGGVNYRALFGYRRL